ncbi:TPA: hypothetical protein SI523_003467 [Escherichia coli]|nr:hypothetical protein [Escherichia coli]HEI2453888.1 hypothetical protein [Escherichia coli]HEI2668002.1 hypothetical protein [Escherichia coli]HEI3925789.1 hypothetical protein [Escherichia coli]
MQELMQDIAMWMMEKQYNEVANGSILIFGLCFLSVMSDALYYLFFMLRGETPVGRFGTSGIFLVAGYVLSETLMKIYINTYGGMGEITQVQSMICMLPMIILPVLAIFFVFFLFCMNLKSN